MKIVLGVDGGASKTHALVVDSAGRALGFGTGGQSNHQVSGLPSALHEIEQAARLALSAARVAPESVEAGCFCLGGADLPEDFALLQPALEGLGMCRSVVLKNDTLAALRAGLSRSWGVVIICGSGFNGAARAPDGREIVLPGMGASSGNWGCGTELAQEVIRLVMRAWDGRGQPTLLTRLVLQKLNVTSEEELLSRLYHKTIDRAQRHSLVPLLFEAGAAGDEPARALILRMGQEVGLTANTLIRRLSLPDDVEVVLAGGIFKGQGPLLLDTIRQVIHAKSPRARIFRPHIEPVAGSALLALEAAGVTVSEAVRETFEATLPRECLRDGGG